MTRKELASEIYKMENKKRPHTITEKEYIKRALNGIGACKGFSKSELIDIYNRRIAE